VQGNDIPAILTAVGWQDYSRSANIQVLTPNQNILAWKSDLKTLQTAEWREPRLQKYQHDGPTPPG